MRAFESFVGKRHRFLQLNITDIETTAIIVETSFRDVFYRSLVAEIAKAAQVSQFRINRAR